MQEECRRMSRGIIYVMSTVVPGLVKIGKTGADSFESRMYSLERNGYSNVVGLHREFAIMVDDYDEKECLLDDIFSKSRVPNTELFALDINMVIQLLSSFEGEQVFPETKTKEEVFDDAVMKTEKDAETAINNADASVRPSRPKQDARCIPDGVYKLSRRLKRNGKQLTTAEAIVKDGIFIITKGTIISPTDAMGLSDTLKEMRHSPEYVKEAVVQKNVEFSSPSSAATFVLGSSANGWTEWTTEDGQPVSIYRDKTMQ